ncbi:sulfotransferase 1C4-like [Pieris brassicae]|uniref:Sulfotransferase domain-containing protein n=1 Tax=Pieris brassicae TaxID=7116 RepID=A0A9P0U0U2_PIEBR|nr:sulfotransferase 1C4-like [Pieris brassicae]CAH4037214.1 unnamed protein product [Pieris brassicae]
MANNNYPYEIKDVDIPDTIVARNHDEIVSIGPKGYIFPRKFREMAAEIYNMEVKPTDVYVFSYPRSGTTWTQELVWLVVNDLDYETASKIPLTDRYPFLEGPMFINDSTKQKLLDGNKGNESNAKDIQNVVKSAVELVNEMPSPRFIKTHLPLSLLPPKALEAKMVYVARDPRDAIVSFYHLIDSMKLANFNGDFKQFWTIKNYQSWSPYFDNVKEAWEMRNHPNLLFLFYEDMKKDLKSSVRRVCDFFGKKYSDDQIAKLCDHLTFDNFKNNPSVNFDLMKKIGLMHTDKEFVRKGKTGGWREYFDEEMTAEADKWIEENLRDTDLRFPSMQ